MINEIKNSITENINERTSNPILGSFIIFFIGYHWNVWVLLFWSDKKGMEKIDELKNIWPDSIHDFSIPAIASIAFIFLYPFIKLFYSLFIKTVNLLQLRYDLYIVRKQVQLEKLNQDREIHQKLHQASFRVRDGAFGVEDTAFILGLLQNIAEKDGLSMMDINKLNAIIKMEPDINNEISNN